MTYTFPFGQPVLPVEASTTEQRDVLVLGAYPSALHVAWRSPDGKRAIQALPVDNEPEPFWDGADQVERVEAWKQAVGFDESIDGSAAPAGRFNGSSGLALQSEYLEPLGIDRSTVCTTDCILTYCASEGVAKAIEERFSIAMPASERPAPALPSHPSKARSPTASSLAPLRSRR